VTWVPYNLSSSFPTRDSNLDTIDHRGPCAVYVPVARSGWWVVGGGWWVVGGRKNNLLYVATLVSRKTAYIATTDATMVRLYRSSRPVPAPADRHFAVLLLLLAFPFRQVPDDYIFELEEIQTDKSGQETDGPPAL
jgi:hypothetical protein